MFTGGPNDTWRRIMRLSYIKISLLQITYPAQERLATSATGIYTISPTLFEQWCGFFYIPQEPDKWKCCEQDLQLYSFSSLSEKTRNCRCHCKGSNFFSVIYSEIRCIVLCVLQTSKLGILFFSVPSIIFGRPLRKHMFTRTSSKGHGFWFVIGEFRFVLFVSRFKVRCFVIVLFRAIYN